MDWHRQVSAPGTLEGFDFAAQPSLDAKQVRDLAGCSVADGKAIIAERFSIPAENPKCQAEAPNGKHRLNPSKATWQSVGDHLATAIPDRLLYHSHVLAIRNDSYRLREKRRSGLKSPMLRRVCGTDGH